MYWWHHHQLPFTDGSIVRFEIPDFLASKLLTLKKIIPYKFMHVIETACFPRHSYNIHPVFRGVYLCILTYSLDICMHRVTLDVSVTRYVLLTRGYRYQLQNFDNCARFRVNWI